MQKFILLIGLFIFPLFSVGSVDPGYSPLNKMNNNSVCSLNWKEKIVLRILQKKIRKKHFSTDQPKVKDHGKTALILGIIALAGLLIPFVNLFSLPLAIIAIVIGFRELKKNPKNNNAKIALLLAWLTVALFIVGFSLVLLILLLPIM
ncbi:MAG: hypothetical protein ACKVOW_04945 [Chitinophagaceae bacterium]